MALSQLSQLAAIGRFNGTTVTQTTPSRGFGAIARTNAVPAGSYDITIDRNIAGAVTAGEAAVLVTAEGTSPVFAFAQYTLVNEVTLRVELFDSAAADFVDTNFSVAIHRVN